MNVDEQFLEEKVPSLSKWNENDPKALSDVITELINLYKLHQVRKCIYFPVFTLLISNELYF